MSTPDYPLPPPKRGRPRKHPIVERRATCGRPPKGDGTAKPRALNLTDPDWSRLKTLAADAGTTATGWIEARIREA